MKIYIFAAASPIERHAAKDLHLITLLTKYSMAQILVGTANRQKSGTVSASAVSAPGETGTPARLEGPASRPVYQKMLI